MKLDSEISIIIPVAPKEEAWRLLLPKLNFIPPKCVFLVGAESRPADLSEDYHWIVTKQGRAKQLNAGARASDKKFLWFLHADSKLSSSCMTALEIGLKTNADGIHYFNLGFYDGSPLMKLTAAGVWIRSHFLKLPFGDQGFVLSKQVFNQLGEFDETSDYGEDHLLIWKAHRLRIPVLPLPATLFTSSRKYTKNGWLSTTSKHLLLTAKQAWPNWLMCMNLRKNKQ